MNKWRPVVHKRRTQKAKEFLTDLLLSKFVGALGGLAAIENEEELSREL